MQTFFLVLTVGLSMLIPNSLKSNPGCSLQMLSPEKYSLVEHFFADSRINEPTLYGVLDNLCAGAVLSDSSNHPTFALVYNPAGYAFLGGTLTEEVLAEVVSYLKTVPKVTLASTLDWEHIPYFEKEGFTPVERIQLKWGGDLAKVKDWEAARPVQYPVKAIDAENFRRCTWHSFISGYFGGDELFLKNAKGFCLIDKHKVIAESYGLKVRGKAEIGVVTSEEYRGHNLGTIITAYMLEYCSQNNLQPMWSCNLDNPASLAIALKLGFVEDCRYYFLRKIN